MPLLAVACGIGFGDNNGLRLLFLFAVVCGSISRDFAYVPYSRFLLASKGRIDFELTST